MRLPRSSRQSNESLSSLTDNALYIDSSVTSVMLVMSDTPVGICKYALMDIESKTSSLRKHYDHRYAGTVPDDLRNSFKAPKKCQNKFICLVNKMLLIKQLRPCLNVQSDSIRAKVFV